MDQFYAALWTYFAPPLTNKIVPTLEDAIHRVRAVTLPLEDARMRATTSMGSWISKLLVMESEYIAGRVTILLVDESLGF